jgi:hypothetical protein
MPSPDWDNPLAAEILQETATSYFAACKKMVAALDALKAFDAAATAQTQCRDRLPRRSELVDDAAQKVFAVVVQREAMHLSRYAEFFDDYDVPPEVRTRMGPGRREPAAGLPSLRGAKLT